MTRPDRPNRPRPARLRPLPAGKAAVLLALLVGAAAGGGCGLFDTAAPEPPRVDDSIPPNFVLPESTLATLSRAVRGRNTSNYSLCFPDTLLEQVDFNAAFDPADLTAWIQSGRIPPNSWTKSNEVSFFPQFVTYNTNAFYDVYFIKDPNRDDINLGPNTKIYNRVYRVWAAGSPVAAGAAGLTFERVGLAGEWKIRYWEDRRDTADVRTWGFARLEGR